MVNKSTSKTLNKINYSIKSIINLKIIIIVILLLILFIYNYIKSYEGFINLTKEEQQELKGGQNSNEKFTEYEGFKYSPKMTIENIKQLKKGQKKMSNMLKEFDRICRKHNIRYFLIGGSLIGVLAYGGWIPWDGDVDLEIAEEDYPRFRKVIQDELPESMWFQDNQSDELYSKNNNIIGKLRDLSSCYIEYSENGGNRWHNGLQIDINIYKYDKSKNRIWFPDNLKVDYLTYEDVYPLKEVPFEDFKVFVMNNYEKYLVNNYGKGWRNVLSIDKRYPHEGIIDADNTCAFHYNKYPKLYK
jgi:phosphorylcholine metabolism protein LicD